MKYSKYVCRGTKISFPTAKRSKRNCTSAPFISAGGDCCYLHYLEDLLREISEAVLVLVMFTIYLVNIIKPQLFSHGSIQSMLSLLYSLARHLKTDIILC